MDDMAGWEMPVSYGDADGEHVASRHRAGLFDLGDTGLVELAGSDALSALRWLTSSDPARLRVGQIQHAALTTAEGTVLDDILIHRLAASHFLLAVNGANLKTDALWILGQAPRFGDVAVVDTSSRYAVVSLQGPASREVLQALTGADLAAVGEFSFTYGEVAGARATISGTMWSGEVGFAILVPPQSAVKVWQEILREGAVAGVVAAGRQARETLRLEAGRQSCGADFDETTSLLEAGLESIVSWDKGDFSGREALLAQRERGLSRRLVGFEMLEAIVAGPGCAVYAGSERSGRVTSGAWSPILQKAIGFAYVPTGHTEPGTEFDVDVDGRRARARTAALPFYQRSKR